MPEPEAETRAIDTDALVVLTERIMTQHWDLSICTCWVCDEGRAAGCRPREQYLHDQRRERVVVLGGHPGPGRLISPTHPAAPRPHLYNWDHEGTA